MDNKTRDELWAIIVKGEGRACTDHKTDAGGRTKYGITQKTYDSVVKSGKTKLSPKSVCDITEAEGKIVMDRLLTGSNQLWAAIAMPKYAKIFAKAAWSMSGKNKFWNDVVKPFFQDARAKIPAVRRQLDGLPAFTPDTAPLFVERLGQDLFAQYVVLGRLYRFIRVNLANATEHIVPGKSHVPTYFKGWWAIWLTKELTEHFPPDFWKVVTSWLVNGAKFSAVRKKGNEVLAEKILKKARTATRTPWYWRAPKSARPIIKEFVEKNSLPVHIKL